jgi:hypothetical protein
MHFSMPVLPSHTGPRRRHRPLWRMTRRGIGGGVATLPGRRRSRALQACWAALACPDPSAQRQHTRSLTCFRTFFAVGIRCTAFAPSRRLAAAGSEHRTSGTRSRRAAALGGHAPADFVLFLGVYPPDKHLRRQLEPSPLGDRSSTSSESVELHRRAPVPGLLLALPRFDKQCVNLRTSGARKCLGERLT